MIGVNANSYGRFMTGKYKDQWSATQNGTYHAAAEFFAREKELGKNAVGKLRARTASSASASSEVAAEADDDDDGDARPAKKAKPAAKTPLPDVSSITTDGLLYLTPGETRKELRSFLQKYAGSIAELGRLAGVPVQSFNKFMNDAGEFGGQGNQAYGPAATLVERFRIATGGAKSKKRKALEDEVSRGIVNSDGGPRLGLDPHGKYLAPAGASMSKDELGRYTLNWGR